MTIKTIQLHNVVVLYTPNCGQQDIVEVYYCYIVTYIVTEEVSDSLVIYGEVSVQTRLEGKYCN